MSNKEVNSHSHSANKKTLTISLIIITVYMVVEVIGGYITNSLALLADAGHMLSDAVSLFVALMAFTFSSKVADYSKMYGYKRFEILAAAINGITLILVAVFIFYESIERFKNPSEIASGGMLAVAFVGLLVNILVAFIMMKGADVKDNLNMRGAYLHVISDMLGSLGAIIAALLIMFFGWNFADPLASVIIAILVFRSGFLVTKSSVHVLMEGVPSNVEVEKVTEKILSLEKVFGLHDLHIWTITSGLNLLTCHVVVEDKMSVFESEKLLLKIEQALELLNIHHVTIQFETSSHKHEESIFCNKEVKEGGNFHH